MKIFNPLQSTYTGGISFFDAEGCFEEKEIESVRSAFENMGVVHITNTNIKHTDDLLPLMADLGFGEDRLFSSGGRTSKDWQEKWAAPGLRRMDYYPPHLTLLPNNEVQYQRSFPTCVLFFSSVLPNNKGRNFIHSAKAVEAYLLQTAVGKKLIEQVSEYGMTIQAGFLDKNHPDKGRNYFQSWQERFGTEDRDEALSKALSFVDEYDECWWKDIDGYSALMTRIVLPGFFTDKRDGVSYLRFPRIAMDAPAFKNGFRCFPLEKEKALLKEAYFETRQGCVWKAGDIVLMDNIRYAHSREPFEGERELLVSMAGIEKIKRRSVK